MEEKFRNLIEMCKNGITLTNENVGEGMFLVDRGTFQLIIPSDNKDDHGYFFINSVKGHYCYSYSDVSVHTYHVLNGEGIFVIGNEKMPVKSGDTVIINPGTTYTYIGRMLLIEEMTPNFKEECEHEVGPVDYSLLSNEGASR